MTTIGILDSGHVGSSLAKAAIAHDYDVVLSNSRKEYCHDNSQGVQCG
jgi:8-hydroxy-5-deazaflavin:NADPH oxidoreductase